MTTPVGWDTDVRRPAPKSVQLASIILVIDAVVAALGIGHIVGLGDFSEAGVQIFGSSYSMDTPLFPWVIITLGAMSVVAGWFAIQLRRFQFVIGVALIWTGLTSAALPLGPGLLIERLILVAALVKGRAAFLD